MTTPDPVAATPARLLDAAVTIFAERGYRAATVREICRRAGANVAAVGYHFGDKRGLHAAALAHARSRSNDRNPLVRADHARYVWSDEPPERRLRLVVRMFLEHLFDAGRPSALAQLYARELHDPTPTLADEVDRSVRRMSEALTGIVRDLAPPDADEESIRRAAISVWSQILYYQVALPMHRLLHPGDRFEPADLDRLADHVVAFSLPGIRALGRPA